jgi:mannose-6-phosphate isomerase
MVPSLIALDGVIRPYAWGSPTAIPDLLGIAPSGQPAAELWFGAHPDEPSAAPDHESTLEQLIASDPTSLLGARDVERFGPRLPFLLKVLAAQRALSVQVHPDRQQARAGFAAEEARGVPRNASERTYKDPNHKPELLCALGQFDALCGFQPVEQTIALLDALDVAQLSPYRAMLAGPDGLRRVFTAWLQLEAPAALLDPVLAACRRLADNGGAWTLAAAHAVLAADDYPGDIGAALSLLLNSVRLQRGEAIFLGSGNVHAYLRGVGVEIMANSDNVLRCGLTPKHVDVPELLRITDFTPLADPRCSVRDEAHTFATPVPDFALSELAIDGTVELTAPGSQILLATDGAFQASADGTQMDLRRGHAVFVAAARPCVMTGKGTVFRATTGE